MTPSQCKYDLTGACLWLRDENRLDTWLRERGGEASAVTLHRLSHERLLRYQFQADEAARDASPSATFQAYEELLTSDELIDAAIAIDPKDIELVMSQVECSRRAAVAAIDQCDGNVVDAILGLQADIG